MVVIRLNRVGSVNEPKYRVLVADSRYWRGGRHLDVVGYYNPKPRGKDKMLSLDVEKINEWVKKGAQPSDRVHKLLKIAKEGPRK